MSCTRPFVQMFRLWSLDVEALNQKLRGWSSDKQDEHRFSFLNIRNFEYFLDVASWWNKSNEIQRYDQRTTHSSTLIQAARSSGLESSKFWPRTLPWLVNDQRARQIGRHYTLSNISLNEIKFSNCISRRISSLRTSSFRIANLDSSMQNLNLEIRELTGLSIGDRFRQRNERNESV